MPDDRSGRDKKARDRDDRQRERAVLEELERGDESEPPVDERELDALDAEFDGLAYPVTGAEVVEAVGDVTVDSDAGVYTVAELVPETADVQFDSPAALRARVARPTVAAAMKQVLEAVATIPNETLSGSQRTAFERTFRELIAVTPDDDDEGVAVMTDWIVDRIRDTGNVPGSRDVRRQAAKFCRENGYKVRNDEWLGV